MQNCKSIDTPVCKADTLSQRQCPETQEKTKQMKNVPYSSAVGSLMYACVRDRTSASQLDW